MIENKIEIFIYKIQSVINNFDIKLLINWFNHLPFIARLLSLIPFISTIIALIINSPKLYALLIGVILKVELKKVSFFEREEGLVDFQINLCFSAFNKDAFVEGIYLVNDEKFNLHYNEPLCLYNYPDNNLPREKAAVKLAIYYTEFDFTQLDENKFQELLLQHLKKKQITIIGLKITENSRLYFTILGRLKGKLDGYKFSKIPINQWSILVKYSSGNTVREIKKKLNPNITS